MKKYLYMILIFTITLIMLVACNNPISDNSDVEINDFDSLKAQEVSDSYLNLLRDGNIDGSYELLTQELSNATGNIQLGDTNIISYKMKKVIESADKAAIVYDVIRSKVDEVRADRDTFTIKVIGNGDKYEVSEVKAANKNQVYSKGDKLMFMGEEGGNSQLVININNLHIDAYPKTQGVMIEKVRVPHDKFGVVSVSYSGNKVALTTTNGTDNFISVIEIDEGIVAQGEETPEGGSPNEQQPVSETSEKSIAKKIIPLDILKSESITKLIFVGDEEKLIVEYLEDGKERINVYSAESGDLIDLGLNEKFPMGEYIIKFNGVDKQLLKIKASGSNSDEIYKVDLEKKEIEKEEK